MGTPEQDWAVYDRQQCEQEAKADAIQKKTDELIGEWSATELIEHLPRRLQEEIYEEISLEAEKILEKEADENFVEPDIDFPY